MLSAEQQLLPDWYHEAGWSVALASRQSKFTVTNDYILAGLEALDIIRLAGGGIHLEQLSSFIMACKPLHPSLQNTLTQFQIEAPSLCKVNGSQRAKAKSEPNRSKNIQYTLPTHIFVGPLCLTLDKDATKKNEYDHSRKQPVGVWPDLNNNNFHPPPPPPTASKCGFQPPKMTSSPSPLVRY